MNLRSFSISVVQAPASYSLSRLDCLSILYQLPVVDSSQFEPTFWFPPYFLKGPGLRTIVDCIQPTRPTDGGDRWLPLLEAHSTTNTFCSWVEAVDMTLHLCSPHHTSSLHLLLVSSPSSFPYSQASPIPVKIKASFNSKYPAWREYDDAVKQKDLARALQFLRNTQPDHDSSPARLAGIGWDRDWDILDTCLNADDMKLVGNAYAFLKEKGLLPSFGKCRNIVLEGPRDVVPSAVKASTGLDVSKLSPKKWGLTGSSSAVLVAFLAGTSFLISQGIDIRTNLAAILGLAFMDSVFLGGTCLALISSYWPPFRRRILVHEAGHLLTAYLMGCPIRGVILDPIVAMQMGIQGQAGTQFWDEKLESELAQGRLSGTAFDRYSMVLFAGIAAEALIYGEAEGGENDENLFRSICLLLEPPLSLTQMSNQARWSVVQSYNLLKWHKNAHRAAVKALDTGASLSIVIRRIEEALCPDE